MSQTKIEAFKKAELKRIADERERYLKEKDYKEFMKWPKGVTDAVLMPVIPRDHLSYGKAKKVFRIRVDDVEYDWSITEQSPLYGEVLELLSYKDVAFQLQRMGDGLQTRYDLL